MAIRIGVLNITHVLLRRPSRAHPQSWGCVEDHRSCVYPWAAGEPSVEKVISDDRGGPSSAQTRLLAGVHTMVLHDPADSTGPERARPEWTILLSPAGHVEWWIGRCPGGHAPGVIFPPQFVCRVSCVGPHSAVLIDPWYQGLGPGRSRAVPLDLTTVEYLARRWSTVGADDLDERARETVSQLRQRNLLPPAVAVDPRVAAAVRDLGATDGVARTAAVVGLSPSRLRALVRDLTGTSPARLRMWRRLRTAMLGLVDKPIALAAADAGFADQAHLTRTATRLIGQTPGDLARMLQAPGARRQCNEIRATATVA
jgi:AraC-like DNA-binding protein